MEIKANEVYTPKETQDFLKVSSSTMTRLIKKELIRAAKVGKQYRIMGRDILRVLSPELEDTVGKIYNKGRRWIHEGIDEPSRKEKELDLPERGSARPESPSSVKPLEITIP